MNKKPFWKYYWNHSRFQLFFAFTIPVILFFISFWVRGGPAYSFFIITGYILLATMVGDYFKWRRE